MLGADCLTVINHAKLDTNSVFLTTDASDFATGACLSFSPDWKSARPVVYNSMILKGAELNYPVHKKELLAIIRALKKWHADLSGIPFVVFTDHRTLENFHKQKDLSRRQARWMEFLSQFDLRIVYIKGEENTVADALSRLQASDDTIANAIASATHPYVFAPENDNNSLPGCAHVTCVIPVESSPLTPVRGLVNAPLAPAGTVGAILNIDANVELLKSLRAGYDADPWCRKLGSASTGLDSVRCDPISKL